jgi:hypothetical protein
MSTTTAVSTVAFPENNEIKMLSKNRLHGQAKRRTILVNIAGKRTNGVHMGVKILPPRRLGGRTVPARISIFTHICGELS